MNPETKIIIYTIKATAYKMTLDSLQGFHKVKGAIG